MSDDNDPWQDLWKANLFHLSKFIGGKSFQLPLKGDEFTLLLGLVICTMSTAPGKLLSNFGTSIGGKCLHLPPINHEDLYTSRPCCWARRFLLKTLSFLSDVLLRCLTLRQTSIDSILVRLPFKLSFRVSRVSNPSPVDPDRSCSGVSPSNRAIDSAEVLRRLVAQLKQPVLFQLEPVSRWTRGTRSRSCRTARRRKIG